MMPASLPSLTRTLTFWLTFALIALCELVTSLPHNALEVADRDLRLEIRDRGMLGSEVYGYGHHTVRCLDDFEP